MDGRPVRRRRVCRVYVLFLIIHGLPIMTMEFAVGRASQKSPVRLSGAGKSRGQMHIHGYLAAMIGTTC